MVFYTVLIIPQSMPNKGLSNGERSLSAFSNDDLRIFNEAAKPTPEQHTKRMEDWRANLDQRLNKIDFDPARSLATDTMSEHYEKEVARLMNVPEGKTPEESLDATALMIYNEHLRLKDDNIKAAVLRLEQMAKEDKKTLDDMSAAEALRALDETMFA